MTALCAGALLSGCSGDDDSSDGSSNPSDSASASASASESPEPPGEACEATVDVTGKVEDSWTGDARVVVNGKQALYSAVDGEKNLLVQSGTKKQPAVVTVAISGDVFVGKPGAKGVEADPKGGAADIDTDVTGQVKKEPVTLRVVATFDC